MSDKLDLFGNSKSFLSSSWQTIDDRVRGGSSHSYLSAIPGNGARFHGNLDIQTLGGAGFASQFSPTSEQNGTQTVTIASNDAEPSGSEVIWDLNEYGGIQISLGKIDGKVYTFILKDESSDGKREDGREKAGINWEVEIRAENEGMSVWKPWREFKATYRGKEKKDAGSLNTSQIKRIGLMMRSYFGTQEGEFNLELKSIAARKSGENGLLPSSAESKTGILVTADTSSL